MHPEFEAAMRPLLSALDKAERDLQQGYWMPTDNEETIIDDLANLCDGPADERG